MKISSQFNKTKDRSRDNDWRLVLTLLPYARRYNKTLILSIILLIPLSISGAIQPIIIGQSVSLLRKEPSWNFLEKLPIDQALQTLAIILAVTILIRLIFLSVQRLLV